MEKKSLFCIIIIIQCIINFCLNWFNGELFDKYPIISMISAPLILFVEVFLLTTILTTWKDNKKWTNLIICLLFTFNIYILETDMDGYKANIKFHKNEENYLIKISNIKEQTIEDYTLLKLEPELSNLSTSGEILIQKTNPLMVKFWIYRGIYIGNSSSLIYIESNKEEDIKNNIPNIFILKNKRQLILYKRN